MAILTTGKTWVDGDQVTAALLNQMVNSAVFDAAALSPTLEKDSASGKLKVSDAGIDTAQLADDAVTTDQILDSAVTKAKIEDMTNLTVLGNTSGSATAPAEVEILDEDDMTSDSAVKLATQQSIKAYVTAYVAANVAQALLTGTNRVYNHSSETVDPVEGTRGDDEAFWLVTDDNGDSMDASLTIASSSKVRVQIHTFTDTNNSNVGVAFKLQRSTDSGSSWTDLAIGDTASTRVRCTYFVGYADGQRSVQCGAYTYVDTPASSSVRYRVLYTAHPNYYIYLNRDKGLDSDGDAGGVSTAEYRGTSNMVIEELKQ